MSDLTELFTWTCSRCDGLTEGFEVIELIVDVQRCLQGFVGVSADLNAIVIAFGGTQENRTAIEDAILLRVMIAMMTMTTKTKKLMNDGSMLVFFLYIFFPLKLRMYNCW